MVKLVFHIYLCKKKFTLGLVKYISGLVSNRLMFYSKFSKDNDVQTGVNIYIYI